MKKHLLLILLFLGICLAPGRTQESPMRPSIEVFTVDFSQQARPPKLLILPNFCWDYENHQVFFARDSALTVQFNLLRKDRGSYLLKVTDRGSTIRMSMAEKNRHGVFCPVTIRMNDQIVVESVNVDWLADTTSSYDVTPSIQTGLNTILFTLAPGTLTRYEIGKIQLLAK